MDIIITGRMSSTRVPGKALYPLDGVPLLQRMVEKCRKVKGVDRVIMSTSDEKEDNKIKRLCETLDVPCYRGPKNDVWHRHITTFWHFNIVFAIGFGADQLFFDSAITERAIQFAIDNPGYELYRPYLIDNAPSDTIMPEYQVFRHPIMPNIGLPKCVLLGQTNYWVETRKWIKQANKLIYMHQARDWMRDSNFKHIASDMGSPRYFNVKWFNVDDLLPDVKGGFPTMKVSLDFPLNMIIAEQIIKYLGRTPDTFYDVFEGYTGIKSLL